MKILFASYHGCIRKMKEATALINRGHELKFLQYAVTQESYFDIIPVTSFYSTEEAYLSHLQAPHMEDVDLIHVHSEPSRLGFLAKEVRPDVPVVFDVHDLIKMRLGKDEGADLDEDKSLALCDGFVFPSQWMYDNIDVDGKPKTLIYSMPGRFQVIDKPRVGGIVYQGGLLVAKNGASPDVGHEATYDYRDLTMRLTKMGIPFILYVTNPSVFGLYRNLGAMTLPSVDYPVLLDEMTRYDWGWVGQSTKNCYNWHRAMPNKLFDYICSGIPIMVHGADECAAFVKKHELGVVLEDIEQIPEVYDQHEKYREIVRAKRNQFTMDNQIERLESLYERVLNG